MSALVTVTLDAGQVVAGIIAAAGLVAAIVYLTRALSHVLQVVHAIERVVERELSTNHADATEASEPLKATVQRELTNNHGSSLKDDVDGMAVGLRVLASQVEDLDDRLTTHLEGKTP